MPRRNASWKKRSKATDLCSCLGRRSGPPRTSKICTIVSSKTPMNHRITSTTNYADNWRVRPDELTQVMEEALAKVEEAGVRAQYELERAEAVLQD